MEVLAVGVNSIQRLRKLPSCLISHQNFLNMHAKVSAFDNDLLCRDLVGLTLRYTTTSEGT